MAKRKKSPPSYRLHKQSGQAVVTLTCTISGTRKDVLLGAYDSADSWAEYARVIAEWEADGRVLDQNAAQASKPITSVTVGETFRRARELATPFLEMPNREQRQWAEDLANRLLQMGADLPAVCVVDSGVNRAHALLEASLVEADQHACETAWGVDDVADQAFIGHGTGMAGLALLGEELPDLLVSQNQVELRHWH